ncbi:MAG: hypothetical protein KJ638_06410 [Chloroflexi bacterium]|nr:hypothetical protein [Chloroflexota bacterium]
MADGGQRMAVGGRAPGQSGDFSPSGMLRESRSNEMHEVHLGGLVIGSAVGGQIRIACATFTGMR